MQVIRKFNEATKLEELFQVCIEINEDFSHELDILENFFNIPIHASIKALVSPLVHREDMLKCCNSIIDIHSLFHNIEQPILDACIAHRDFLLNVRENTIKEFIEKSERIMGDLTLGLDEKSFYHTMIIINELANSRALLSFLLGEKQSGSNNFTTDTFEMMKEGLDDSDYSEILTKEMITDLKDTWTSALIFQSTCTSFDELITMVLESPEKYSEITKKASACNKHLDDIKDFLISLENKEEYKKEIIKKICESSSFKFHKHQNQEKYYVSLK